MDTPVKSLTKKLKMNKSIAGNKPADLFYSVWNAEIENIRFLFWAKDLTLRNFMV